MKKSIIALLSLVVLVVVLSFVVNNSNGLSIQDHVEYVGAKQSFASYIMKDLEKNTIKTESGFFLAEIEENYLFIRFIENHGDLSVIDTMNPNSSVLDNIDHLVWTIVDNTGNGEMFSKITSYGALGKGYLVTGIDSNDKQWIIKLLFNELGILEINKVTFGKKNVNLVTKKFVYSKNKQKEQKTEKKKIRNFKTNKIPYWMVHVYISSDKI